ncbi:DUF1513 domain-containing protein [Plastorhodobacter daqingensis]|uniref:DUF1513 domain-containing protein n=1 Tax=Plastorhodobacter daqingensis TaxID=1387281 RepID=A0ABW2UPX2_9RHOB
MTTRRHLLAGVGAGIAAAAMPACGWAEVGAPNWLSAARLPDGPHVLCGLRVDGTRAFTLPLPARGHAGARHPTQALAVAMARRPGTFALVIDCATGRVRAELGPPEGVHFNGHAAFLAEGSVLATAEQNAQDSAGQIGLWDSTSWRRIATWPSGGIGPHDIAALPDGRLAVANGGIATDPTDRRKLNIATMRPNLTVLGADGQVDAVLELPDLWQNSIRHLAIRADGHIAFAMQWEGEATAHVPLVGLWRPSMAAVLAEPPLAEALRMQGYAGSVAWSGDGQHVAITSPRGGRVQVFDAAGRYLHGTDRPDVCGLAPDTRGFVVSDGTGAMIRIGDASPALLARHPLAWDNHLIPV